MSYKKGDLNNNIAEHYLKRSHAIDWYSATCLTFATCLTYSTALTKANARNVSFSISVRWSIYIINSVNKPNFRVSLPHRRSTTVSSETNPVNLQYRLLSTNYTRKLLYRLRTNCPKSLSTSSRTYEYYVNCGHTNEMKMWSSQLCLRF